MNYYRCKCGKIESWTSTGVSKCDGCPYCNTTLEEYSEHHKTPQPHEFIMQYDTKTGDCYEMCKVCLKTKKQLEKYNLVKTSI
jgi:hypothetical protein